MAPVSQASLLHGLRGTVCFMQQIIFQWKAKKVYPLCLLLVTDARMHSTLGPLQGTRTNLMRSCNMPLKFCGVGFPNDAGARDE